MNQPHPNRQEEVYELLQSVRKRLWVLSAAVILMLLALLLTMSAVYGSLVNYFNGDAMLFGGCSVGAALLGFGFGFGFGWFARRRA